MKTTRRRALASLTTATGSLLFAGPSLAAAPASPAAELVTGIGGFFFRARNPEALGQWYRDHLGIPVTPQSYTDPVWKQEAGPTILTPFPEDSAFFGDPEKRWLLNLRVLDLDALSKRLEASGITVKRDPKTYPNGRFARIHDPEGNPIELWQPVDPANAR